MRSSLAGQRLDAGCVEELQQRVAVAKDDLRHKFEETKDLPFGKETFSGIMVQVLTAATLWGWTAGYDPCQELLNFSRELQNTLAA
ncbi:MAG: hypothetical protein HUU49_00235 [Candidatus Buchananbacteria bacterium]|nr:hypothetical protein [Candidatus Buchananbacteria bacterium]